VLLILKLAKVTVFRSTGFFVYGSSSISLRTISDSGEESEATNEVLGAIPKLDEDKTPILAQYKIVSEKAQKVVVIPVFYYSYQKSVDFMGYKYEYDFKYYISLKKDTEQTISSVFELDDKAVTIKYSNLYFYNENKATVEVKNGDDTEAHINNAKYNNTIKETREGLLSAELSAEVISKQEPNKDYSFKLSADVKITGKDGKYPLPEKFFQITEDTIYTKSTEDAEMENLAGGLSTGAIIGIVIGCVVFVAIVAFCIYWFCIRKSAQVGN
jgi:hypothetical protein